MEIGMRWREKKEKKNGVSAGFGAGGGDGVC